MDTTTTQHVLKTLNVIQKDISTIKERVDGIEGKVGSIEERLGGVEGKLNGVEGKLEGMEERIEDRIIEHVGNLARMTKDEFDSVHKEIAANRFYFDMRMDADE